MRYVALVYVHGIGEQQRYFELSRLIERLERYAKVEERTADGHGALTFVRVQREPDRIRNSQQRTFLLLRRDGAPNIELRAYEAYWAPFTAGGRAPIRVLRWLLRQWWAPIRGLVELSLRRRFDLHHRHHVVMLYEWVSRRRKRNVPVRVMSRLLQRYHHFIRACAQGPSTGSPKEQGCYTGSPKEFVNSVEQRLQRFARAWVCFARRFQLKILFVLTTIALSLFVLPTVVATSLLISVDPIGLPLQSQVASSALFGLGGRPIASLLTPALPIIIFGLAALVGGFFLKRYLGDVKVWTTYQETELDYRTRRAILFDVRDLFLHILQDQQCQRLVIVGHSLGTSIAYEALISLRENFLTFGKPIGSRRIDRLITLGSPIDKIHYFFHYNRATNHRFEQVLEELRGDLDDWPYMRWINIFDPADVISGSIQSPSSCHCALHRVENLKLSLLCFPSPGKTHLAYFDDWRVLKIIYHSLVGRNDELDKALGEASIEDRKPVVCWQVVLIAALLLPWALLIATVLAWGGWLPSALYLQTLLFVATLLVIYGIGARLARPLEPLSTAPRRNRTAP